MRRRDESFSFLSLLLPLLRLLACGQGKANNAASLLFQIHTDDVIYRVSLMYSLTDGPRAVGNKTSLNGVIWY